MRCALLAILAIPLSLPAATEFANGRWLDGRAWRSGTVYAEGGILTRRKPQRIEQRVDLGGRYIVPAPADAWTASGVLDSAVFYGKSPAERAPGSDAGGDVLWGPGAGRSPAASRPGFLRVDFTLRKPDPAALAAKARAAQLPVSALVETAGEFAAAVKAKAQEIAGLPGFRLRAAQSAKDMEIADGDARLAAQNRIFVVTAAARALESQNSPRYAEIRQTQSRNLKLLYGFGVPVILGSGSAAVTAAKEVEYLHGLFALDEMALLKMWCEETPLAIFPQRRIGCLGDGCEASFLALPGNPEADVRIALRPAFRVKLGKVLP